MKLVDLSHTILSEMPVYPGDINVSLTQGKFLEKDYYNAFYLHSGLHAGTHVDVPMHFTKDNLYICDFPLERFAGEGAIIDVQGLDTISYKEEYEDIVCENNILILFTGFSDYFNDKEKYFKNHPSIDNSFTDFLIRKKIKMLGIDFPSPDKSPYTQHKRLLENNIFILENLTNLSALKAFTYFDIFAMPLKLTAEASLVRAYAILSNSR